VPVPEFDPAAFVGHLRAYADAIPAGARRIVAIAGPPASGKSTLAAELHATLNEASAGSCALLPMDGFHYDDEVLVARGWLARKGAPHTFDVGGYAAALRRLRANGEVSVAVPRFDRTIEIARAGAIVIERDVRLIVTEGNYLLVDDDPWRSLRSLFDHAALIVAESDTLTARNRQRWIDMDKDEDFIRVKLESNDLPNVHYVAERSAGADWIVRT
jgi:pantothenate kinase